MNSTPICIDDIMTLSKGGMILQSCKCQGGRPCPGVVGVASDLPGVGGGAW